MCESTENLVVELKTELRTVVEALSFLHEFVESVFGAKYHNFVTTDTESCGKDVHTILKRLRWKHLPPVSSTFESPVVIKSEEDAVRRESKGDNGYSSSGATPAPLERRWSSTSSSRVFSPPVPQEPPQFQVNDPSEGVAVKCEVDDSTFLDDVDPFNSDPTEFAYYEDSELQISNTCALPGTPGGKNPSRFLPELIPIQSEPIVEAIPKDESSEEYTDSDSEWQPSSVSSKKSRRTLPLPQPKGGNGPFKCDMCPASYKQEESLRSHQKYKHNPSRVQCTCHLCGKSMVDKYRLQRHLRLHTGEKPFECELCGQSFYRKDYHTKHLQRKHGIHYSSPSLTVTSKRKPKPEGNSSQYNTYMSNVFETPSPPQRKAANRVPVSSPSSISTSPGTSSSQASSGEVTQPPGRSDIYSQVYNGGTPINNLMTMANLTFDDLISADL